MAGGDGRKGRPPVVVGDRELFMTENRIERHRLAQGLAGLVLRAHFERVARHLLGGEKIVESSVLGRKRIAQLVEHRLAQGVDQIGRHVLFQALGDFGGRPAHLVLDELLALVLAAGSGKLAAQGGHRVASLVRNVGGHPGVVDRIGRAVEVMGERAVAHRFGGDFGYALVDFRFGHRGRLNLDRHGVVAREVDLGAWVHRHLEDERLALCGRGGKGAARVADGVKARLLDGAWQKPVDRRIELGRRHVAVGADHVFQNGIDLAGGGQRVGGLQEERAHAGADRVAVFGGACLNPDGDLAPRATDFFHLHSKTPLSQARRASLHLGLAYEYRQAFPRWLPTYVLV